MRRLLPWCFLALVVAPALLVGALALRLLEHEQERMEAQSRAAARDRVGVAAERIETAILDLQQVYADRLEETLGAADPAGVLASWERRDPMVRNTFVLDGQGRLAWPDPDGLLSADQRAFLLRYEAFFSGRRSLAAPSRDKSAPSPGTAPSYPRIKTMSLRGLRQAAKAPSALEASSPGVESGWLPWFQGQTLHLLGWVRETNGITAGVELETMALLSRLQPALPSGLPDGTAFALADGAGRVLLQSGPLDIPPGVEPQVSVPIGPAAPHWTMTVHNADGAGAGSGARSYRVLAGLMVMLLVLAAAVGGILLLREAGAQRRDAERKTSFVSNVSHELRSPLTSIRMYAELLAEGRAGDREKQTDYLGVIVEESARLTRLVNNVLDFSRLEQHRKRYRCQALDAAALVRELLERHDLRLRQAGLVPQCDLPDDLPAVKADRDAMEQILVNLLDNAAKYAVGGGELLVRARAAGGRVRVSVCDRGPGIGHSHRRRVFEKFYRADDSLTAAQPGSGLGLAIARRLARDLGGDLACRRREGGGACFTLILTAADPEEAP